MKTTLELPDDLMRTVKVRAANENRRLKDTIAELLARGLASDPQAAPTARRRVRLPLVRCAHPAHRADEVTPERAAQILLAADDAAHRDDP